MFRGITEIHLTVEADHWFESLERVTLNASTETLPHDSVEIDEHPSTEQAVHFVLPSGEASHEASHRLLPSFVQFA